jgi:type I restriction enzyme M protein
LGSAYEYLIKIFADSAGKKGGEFYIPSEGLVRSILPFTMGAGYFERDSFDALLPR